MAAGLLTRYVAGWKARRHNDYLHRSRVPPEQGDLDLEQGDDGWSIDLRLDDWTDTAVIEP